MSATRDGINLTTRRRLLAAGVLAPIVYVFAVVLGGILRRDYSHLSQAISELSGSAAPDRVLMAAVFAVSASSAAPSRS